MRVLILGGTAEARALASELVGRDVSVISSLAGRVSRPRMPVGEVRIGGFGGTQGLADFIRSGAITHVIDATHPFAVTMTRHGIEAAAATGVSFARYARPGWRSHPHASQWTWVASYDEARTVADRLGVRPMITTGRQTLGHFVEPWRERDVLTRIVEPLDFSAPPRWRVVLDRGPYDVAGELALMREHGADVLLTKDSGGSYTSAKLDAAAELGVPVVVVSRPEAPAGARQFSTLTDTLDAIRAPR